MKWLFNLFKQFSFWLIVGFLLAAVILVIIGFLFDWSNEVKILSIVILILFFVFVIMYRNLRSARGIRKIEQSLDTPLGYLGPERKKEIEQFRQKMMADIQSLKKSQLSKFKKGRSNLYALPWYIFIGPPNSGKTTIIEQSGLTFPFGIETAKTNECELYFSSSSVLVDTAGKIIEEEEQGSARGEWYALLEILRKFRRRQPLNGIIASVSIADLLRAGREEVEAQAKLLRNRVNELIRYSGMHLPLYVVFTKCDEVVGFKEFFAEFQDKELDQIWGYTFGKKQKLGEDTDKVFEKEFQNLLNFLSLFQWNAIASKRTLEKQQKVYDFPEKFCSLKDTLTKFIGKFFQANFYADNPLLRGFYFTSATQIQLPANSASEEIEMQFNPETHVTKTRESVIQPRSYFLGQLFSRIIIPEQYLVKPTSRMKLQTNLRNVLLSLATLFVLSFFILNVIMATSRNSEDMATLKAMVNAVEKVDWNQKLGPSHFELLEQVQNYRLHLQDKPFLSGSIYQGERLIAPINRLFVRKFSPFISTYLYRDILSKYLKAYLSKDPGISRDQAYEYLRGYLLLDNQVAKLSQITAEKEFLKNLTTVLVDSMFDEKFNMAYQSKFNEHKIISLKSLIQSEVAYFVEAISVEDTDKLDLPFKNDKRLVEGVRRILGKPDISDIYARIKREGQVKFQQIPINQIIPGYTADFFEGQIAISGFFSKDAWENYVSEEIENSSKNPEQDDWVLNIAASQLPPEMQDAKLMEKKLKQRYFYDYGRAWWGFLGQIRYIPFADTKKASEQLGLLGDFLESPLRKIIEIVAYQTKYEGLIDQKAQELKKELGLKAKGYSIDDQFQFLHALSEDEGGKLADLLSQFEVISGFMETLSEDPGEKSAALAAAIIQQDAGELPEVLRSIRRSLRRMDQNARMSVFEKPVLMSMAVLMDKTQQYLNQQWSEQVYQPFQMIIAKHYPINRKSNTETPPADIARFFKKNGGTLWNFITTELEPFLKTKSFNPDTWEGYGLHLSEHFKASLQKASAITEGLGLHNQDDLKLDFKILPQLPVSKSGSAEQIKLSIDGQELVYRMGKPTWESLIWPNPESISSARLEVRTRIGIYRPQQFDGAWGWFRLLDQAIIQKSTASDFNVEWRFPPDQNYEIQVKFKIRANSINNPFGQEHFFSISLPSSLSD